MHWLQTHRGDPQAHWLANHHYNRQGREGPVIGPPGRNIVLVTKDRQENGYPTALWITNFQKPEFVDHAHPGAWNCATFRNEGTPGIKSSELILQALAVSRFLWGDPPPEGMITFVDESKVEPKQNPGFCYIIAGFRVVGRTQKRDLIILHLPPEKFPPPCPPVRPQLGLF